MPGKCKSKNKKPKFQSERWDVNAMVNNEEDIDPNTYRRLFALRLLWLGRYNDIQDRHSHDEKKMLQAEIYKQIADEYLTAIKVIFDKE